MAKVVTALNVNRLRAAVLGAKDGIVESARFAIWFCASQASHASVVLAGVAAHEAGAISMATGDFVSMSSQAHTEQAALCEERKELQQDNQAEHRGLVATYVRCELELALVLQVAEQLMAYDVLAKCARRTRHHRNHERTAVASRDPCGIQLKG